MVRATEMRSMRAIRKPMHWWAPTAEGDRSPVVPPDVEAVRVGQSLRIQVRGRDPDLDGHPLPDRRATDLGVDERVPREPEEPRGMDAERLVDRARAELEVLPQHPLRVGVAPRFICSTPIAVAVASCAPA